MLISTESRDALWAASRDRNSSSVLRRAAFESLLLGEPADVAEVLKSALADFDPRIGLWALRQSGVLAQPDQRLVLLKVALVASHAAVRRTALGLYAALRPDELAEALRAALFDASRGVRSAAAFQLEHSCGESALPAWRAAVTDSERRRRDIALLALCELGTAKTLRTQQPTSRDGMRSLAPAFCEDSCEYDPPNWSRCSRQHYSTGPSS